MTTLKSIYIAGKMQNDYWRQELLEKEALTQKHSPILVDSWECWPEISNATVCGLIYTGPFFVDTLGGHGFRSFDENDRHGSNIDADLEKEEKKNKQNQVQQWCLNAIKRADVLVAWIDSIDCYGTIAEIGYAKALGKPVWIAGPRQYHDLWFIYTLADQLHFTNMQGSVELKELIEEWVSEYNLYHLEFDSPIESAFWQAWLAFRERTYIAMCHLQLESQYQIGRYRVDFANVPTKTAIELDGHATHSSPDAIAYDRKRGREIEEKGWHVVRFGGKEVYTDVEQCVVEVWMLLARRWKELHKEDVS